MLSTRKPKPQVELQPTCPDVAQVTSQSRNRHVPILDGHIVFQVCMHESLQYQGVQYQNNQRARIPVRCTQLYPMAGIYPLATKSIRILCLATKSGQGARTYSGWSCSGFTFTYSAPIPLKSFQSYLKYNLADRPCPVSVPLRHAKWTPLRNILCVKWTESYEIEVRDAAITDLPSLNLLSSAQLVRARIAPSGKGGSLF